MAFPGWLKFGGSEIINIERTTSYIRALMPQLQVAPARNCEDVLHQVLGQGDYTTPMDDNAPWYDPKVPESHGFAGFYPLSITGLDDDVRSATVTQGNFDGGFISPPRRATREIRVSGLLVGETESCVDYGLFWLRQMLDSDVRRAKIGRMDPTGSETMASIPDLCGEEKGDVNYLASCPELGCGDHCGHVSGRETAHPVSLSTLRPTGGTWLNLSGTWTFTPVGQFGKLTTPNLPDTQTCPVRYVWKVLGQPGATIVGQGIRDGVVRTVESMPLAARRTNLATNPQWKTAAGTVVARKNLAINPSLRSLCAPTVVQTNRVANPRAGTNLSGQTSRAGTGGTSAFSRVTTGGPLVNAPTFARQTYSVAQTAHTTTAFLSVGVNGDATYEIPVAAGEKVSASMYLRTSLAGQSFVLQFAYFNAVNGLVGSVNSVTFTPAANTWTLLTHSDPTPVPAGTTKVVVYCFLQSGTLFGVGATMDASAWNLSRNERLVIPYFDGATGTRGGQSFAWVGTAHASPSTATGYYNLARTNASQNPRATNTNGYGADAGGGATSTTLFTNSMLVVNGNAITNYAQVKFTTMPTDQSAVGAWFGRSSASDLRVQPGQKMIFSVYARTNVFDRVVKPEVRYYAEDGTLLATRSGTNPFGIGGTVFTRVYFFDPTPVPLGASRARFTLRYSSGGVFIVGDTIDLTATAAETTEDGVLFAYFDGNTPNTTEFDHEWQGISGLSSSLAYSTQSGGRTIARTNYALNPEQSAAYPPGIITSNATNWPLTQNASLGRSLTTRSASNPSGVVSTVNLTGGAGADTSQQPTAAGDVWTFSVDLFTTAADRTFSAQMFTMPGSAVLGSPVTGTIATAGSTVGPVRVAVGGTMPAGATHVYVQVQVSTGTGNAPTNEVVYFDNLLVEKCEGVRTYFSGDFISPSNSGLSCQWEGAPNFSRSLAVGPCLNKTLTGAGSTPFWQSDNTTPTGGRVGSVFVTGDPGPGIAATVLRTNLAKNPSGRATSGTAEMRRNKVVNPQGRALGASATVRNNYIPNPSFEVNTTSWGTYGSTAPTLTRVQTGASATGFSGAWWLSVAYTVALSGTTVTATGLTIGNVYTVSGYVWNPTGNPSVAVRDVNTSTTSTRTNLNDQWQRVWLSFTATATSHQFQFGILGTGGSNIFYLDGVQLEDGAFPTGFFDGSTPDITSEMDFQWVGTASNSASIAVATRTANWQSGGTGGQWYSGNSAGAGIGVHCLKALNLSTAIMTGAVAGEFYSARATVAMVPSESYWPAGTNPAVSLRLHDGSAYVANTATAMVTLPTDGSAVTIDTVSTGALTATNLRLYAYPYYTDGTTNTNSPAVALKVLNVIVEKVPAVGYPVPVNPDFFDGTSVGFDGLTCSWVGTANASESVATGTKLTFDNQSTWPGTYRSALNTPAGFSAVMLPGASIDVNRAAGDTTLNGHLAGLPTTISFFMHKGAYGPAGSLQTVTASLFSKPSGGSFTAQSVTIPLQTDADHRVSATLTPPSDAASVYWRVTNNAGENLYASQFLIENSPTANEWFDGASADIPGFDYTWTGAADLSWSTLSSAQRLLIQGAGDTVVAPAGWYAAKVKVRMIGAVPQPSNTINIQGHFYGGSEDYGMAVQSQTVAVTDQWQEVCLPAYTLAPSGANPSITWDGVSPSTTWDNVGSVPTWDTFTGP